MTLLLASGIAPAQAHAQKFKVLHTFHGANGGEPLGVLVRDSAGNIYGTTGSGGTSGYGTVFKLSKSGKERVLYSFTGPDGGNPYLGFLLMDANGNLYGTTSYGGSDGYGTVWKLTP